MTKDEEKRWKLGLNRSRWIIWSFIFAFHFLFWTLRILFLQLLFSSNALPSFFFFKVRFESDQCPKRDRPRGGGGRREQRSNGREGRVGGGERGPPPSASPAGVVSALPAATFSNSPQIINNVRVQSASTFTYKLIPSFSPPPDPFVGQLIN